jgi:N-acetylmuramoyl-L-alanine amidase
VRYLYCAGAISGYSDNTFRPYNATTRGQMVKIIVIAFGYEIYTPATPTFTDVPANRPFYTFVETAAASIIVSGYGDGTFRPYNNVTRGQLSKITVVAAGWPLLDPAAPSFIDVPRGSPFYVHVETAYDRGIISGYSDNTFRPYNDATRGQISKIVHLAVISP